MIIFPQHLAAHDIAHLGVLLKRIRATRSLSQADIAQALGITNSTISKFESTGRSRRGQIVERYIRSLQSPCINNNQIPYPLESDEADLLLQLAVEYHGGQSRSATDLLSAYDFELIASPYCPPELKALVQRLRRLQWPAYISDGLGFIHAMNSGMLNLFGIAPDSLWLRRWEGWHLLAINLTNPSPVRSVYINPNNYMLTMVGSFFRNTLLYLFTPQMRALLRALHHLSYLNGFYFSKWWYSASSFSLFLGQNENTHILRHGTRYLHTSIMAFECHWVHITATMSVPYYLTVWQPVGTETQAHFEHLNGQTVLGHVFFAATYDSERRHHVNCWSDVAQEL